MVVALGAHSFAPIPPSPLAGPGDGPASPGRPGQGAQGATSSVWVPPWVTAEQKKVERYNSLPQEQQIRELFLNGDLFAQIKLDYVSPSAIETIDLCERKWAFVKLDRLDKGFSASAQLGTDTHAQHERWFLEGVPYDLTTRAGELALATSDLLPPRDQPGLRVEQEMRFAWPSVPGVLLGGKIDLNWREAGTHVVLDHKTSGNVSEYGKLTRDALLHHPQAPVYGAFGFLPDGEERIKDRGWVSYTRPIPDDVELRWNYVNTKNKPYGMPSWHEVRPEEIHDAVERYVAPGARRILQIVDQANQTRRTGTPFGAKDLPFPDPGKKACTAFGGCAFRSVCGISPAKGIAIMADASQDFLVRMGLAPAPLAPAPAPQASVEPGIHSAPASVPLPPPPVGYGAASLPSAHPTPAPGPAVMGYGAQINPPENTLPAPVAPTAPPPASTEAAAPKTRKPRTPRATSTDSPADNAAALGLEPDSFLERAVLAVLPSVAAALVPGVLSGQFQPSAVGTLALEIAKAATAGIES